MLDYLARFESVQDILMLGFVFAVCTFAIGYNARRAMLVKDTEKENDHRRKIEMINIEDRRKLIESKAEAVQVDEP